MPWAHPSNMRTMPLANSSKKPTGIRIQPPMRMTNGAALPKQPILWVMPEPLNMTATANIIAKTDKRGFTSTFVYDKANRLVKEASRKKRSSPEKRKK